jgi:hypothetical protein
MEELVLVGEEIRNAGVLLDLRPPFWVLQRRESDVVN